MSIGQIELRRLEQLSNTIFGVAMTLLAYQAPREKFVGADPQWHELWRVYGAFGSTLLLSFIVAGMFWMSHQQRLAYASHATRGEVILNLLFLLSIVLLPVTCGLYGNNFEARNVTILYSANLLLIALFNTTLWTIAAVRRRDWPTLITPIFSLLLFVVALGVSLIDPRFPKFIWPIAFLTPALAAYVERRRSRPSTPIPADAPPD
ncbi:MULTISPECIES: TMEM175 family protein [Rhodopseudomonas]|uniref:DUF1211 domain-containing protein n=1 Tax=Rhodopseudomonas palustris TaxID=1076 RepID=A0A0D7EJ52_RHOPL|nr:MULTISPECIES: TMEM175 family protein [Rhodopseudomonas]KIZ40560.1 hypothetical protein OO17_17440 [Rhodopseudomonas palustris]MDF3808811.1 TMEM175 family protein [Rhodopseudomonas sp. BAL398]WOK19155.1 TMEM175 family protein [Rhodopseudomonas sp. BAL398]